MFFEWSAQKARSNLLKHGVSFEEAMTVFRDPLAVTFPDEDHSGEEHREITIGHTIRGRVVFVSHVQRGNSVRLIGAREATAREVRQYEE